MKIELKALFLFCLTAISDMASAQTIRTLPNFSKLPGPVVRSVLQDEEGYIWYGTTECGLLRDNGYQIDQFMGDERTGFSRSDCFINKMFATSDHRLLFTTSTGVWVLDKRSYQIERLDTLVTKGHNFQSVLMDKTDNSYWLTSGGTVFHLSRDCKLVRSYDITHNGTPQHALSLYIDSKDRIWLMLEEGGLRLYDRKKDGFEDCQWPTEWSPLVMHEDQKNGCFWIGTRYGGIIRYEIPDNKAATQGILTMQPATTGSRESHDNGRGFVFGICLVDDKLWVSAIDNFYCYEIVKGGKELNRYPTSDFLPRQRIMLEPPSCDSQGNIWVPSYTPIPFVITPKGEKVRRFMIDQMERVTDYPLIADAVVPDGDGFWLMQSRVGLMYYRPDNEFLTSILSSAEHLWLYSLKMKGRKKSGNGVWVAEGSNLWSAWMEGNTLRTDKVAELESTIHCVYETQNGDVLLGMDNYITKVGSKQDNIQKITSATGQVNDLVETNDGTIYLLGSQCGFAKVKANGGLETIATSHPFDCIATDGNHYIWLSSAEGQVACYDITTHKLTNDPTASDHQGSVIKKLQVDSNGHVWVLTSLYIKEYNPSNGTYRMINITDSNIKADYFQDIKVTGKTVCFCGAGGIYDTASSEALESNSETAHATAAEVDIDSVRVFPSYGNKHITVPADAKHVIVYLTTFDHLHSEKVSFAYRLKKSGEQEWVYLPAGLNVVHLSNLSKGDYELEVKSTNEQGKWNEGELVLTIEKLPAWWETWWAWMLYLILFSALALLGLRYYLRMLDRKHLEEMEQRLTDMKFRFFTNISHELRTPLTLIITPLGSIVNEMKEGEMRRKLEVIMGHAKELLDMINNLLSFRKLEMGEMKLNLRYGELNDYVAQACESFRPLYDKKGVSLHYTPNSTPLNFYFDKNIVHHILFNLLSNAHKFTPEGGDVAVSVKKLATGMVQVEVADTGVGISKEQQKHIFERFYQADSGAEQGANGSGIGLNMVKEMVAIHGGTVSVESDLGEGAVFTVMLPWKTSAESKNKNIDTFTENNSTEAMEKDEPKTDSNKQKADNRFSVLVVEDNDEFRQFIADELINEFHVIQASNGQEGIEIAEAEQVDLVVSDVMMPVMDGFELCRHLKDNEKTSHLSIILLTARAGQESELQGYQCGADYYITKPFDMKILKDRIRQVEKQRREHSQELLRQLENPDVDTLFTSDIESQFVNKIIDLLNKNISNSDYGLEELSSDLCMSYITAYRKIKSITGQAPGEFIRHFRLKRSCQLLRSTSMPVTEVSMSVGFSTPSYFTRSFLKEYNMTPSEYRKKKQDDSQQNNPGD